VTRAGIVAVVGRPNVGKSSLVNALVGDKVSIVSDTSQTTRIPVRGVLTSDGFQAVFTDTPGLHKPRTPLGERLNLRVDEALEDPDVVLLVVDAADGVGRGDAFVAERATRGGSRVRICAVNKVDRVRHERLVPQLVAAAALAEFDHVIPVSARTGRGLDELIGVVREALPEGGPLFPEDRSTDEPLERRIAESVREQALDLTRDEVPHAIAVEVEEVDRSGSVVRIDCRIFVERESQKGILVGRGGATLREIGSRARPEIERLVGGHVYLDLRVAVLPRWQRNPTAWDRLGL
jgi:GTP-binding protein Era